MSQIVSQSGPLTLELSKFSYSTCGSLRGLIQWTHIDAGIVAAIDSITMLDANGLSVKRLLMKILEGGAIVVCAVIAINCFMPSIDHGDSSALEHLSTYSCLRSKLISTTSQSIIEWNKMEYQRPCQWQTRIGIS